MRVQGDLAALHSDSLQDDGRISLNDQNPYVPIHFATNSVATHRCLWSLLAISILMLPTRSADAFGFRGDMLVADFAESKVLAFNPSNGAYVGLFADLGSGAAQTLAEGPNGDIYVSSPDTGRVVAYDGDTGQIVSGFQLSPLANYPSGLTFDSSGHLYVINQLAGTVNQYDPTTGALIGTTLGNVGTGAVGIAYSGGSLYVTDSAGIQQFNLTGHLLNTFGGSFFQITTGPNGNLYAADGNSSVYEFTPSGTQVGSGPFVTGVTGVYGAGFGPDGSLYAASLNNFVDKFDSNGNPVGNSPFFTSPFGSTPGLSSVIYDAVPASVPEPSTLAMLTIAALAIPLRMRSFTRTSR